MYEFGWILIHPLLRGFAMAKIAKKRSNYASNLVWRLSGSNKNVVDKTPEGICEPLYHPEKIKAYRLEVEICGETYGPYSAGCHDSTFEDVCWKMRTKLRGHIKEPDEDGCKVFNFGMLTGFQDIHMAPHWFGGVTMLKELMDAGFVMSEYEVERAYPGETQVVWYKNNAVKIASFSFDEVLSMIKDRH